MFSVQVIIKSDIYPKVLTMFSNSLSRNENKFYFTLLLSGRMQTNLSFRFGLRRKRTPEWLTQVLNNLSTFIFQKFTLSCITAWYIFWTVCSVSLYKILSI